MRFFERAVSRVVLGTCVPVALMLAGWWGSLALLGDSPWIPWAALVGLALGVALDLTVLRSRLDSLYELSAPALTGIAVFYSVLIYGFFMGFPVANLLVGVCWGFVIGRRRAADGIRTDQALAELRIASRTAAAIMFVLCCATAWMALSQPTIGSEMRGMLGLPFTPTMNSLRALALFGGIGLVAAEYVFTRVTANWAAGFAPTAAHTGRASRASLLRPNRRAPRPSQGGR